MSALASPDAVVWHDLECGDYHADLPLWLELEQAQPTGTVLDIGAGSGRVTLALARAGRRVIALDRDARLLAALAARAHAEGLDVETVCADARELCLPGGEPGVECDLPQPARAPVALCIAAMQTVQLLGGRSGRLDFLRHVRTHLRSGGLLACALVEEVEAFDCAAGDPLPHADQTRRGGRLYTSQPVRVHTGPRSIAIARRRWIDDGPVEHELIELDRLSARELEREGAAVDLHSEPVRTIAATEEHAGGVVVMLRA